MGPFQWEHSYEVYQSISLIVLAVAAVALVLLRRSLWKIAALLVMGLAAMTLFIVKPIFSASAAQKIGFLQETRENTAQTYRTIATYKDTVAIVDSRGLTIATSKTEFERVDSPSGETSVLTFSVLREGRASSIKASCDPNGCRLADGTQTWPDVARMLNSYQEEMGPATLLIPRLLLDYQLYWVRAHDYEREREPL